MQVGRRSSWWVVGGGQGKGRQVAACVGHCDHRAVHHRKRPYPCENSKYTSRSNDEVWDPCARQ